jgi:aldehyde:ferredoxin oxidoreductase
MYGYAGKIVRIKLDDCSCEIVSTGKYVPEYIGGRAVCNRIFWDEVKPGTRAFDPGNKIIYMTGPATGTGIPTGGRSVFTGIAPNLLPEQYSWSGIGGWFGAYLKFAGYDGFIIEGKAKDPTYVFIDDDDVQFLPAEPLWGLMVHPTQDKIEEIHGKDVQSIVIGPAGEHLMRNATITTSNDNVAAKSGFGAVLGSKNLKAVTVRGTGSVHLYDIETMLKLRDDMAPPNRVPNPVVHETTHGPDGNNFPVEWTRGQVSCCHGCNQRCNKLMIDMKSAFSDEKINMVEKCVGIFAYAFVEDCGWLPSQTFQTERNHMMACKFLSGQFPVPDTEDPHFEEMFKHTPGDRVNFWKPDFDKGSIMMDMCNEYGVDKWDVLIWYLTWLSMAKKEGLLDDLDFGMEVDVENEAFVRYFLDMITFRKGKYGEIFAEGMARAIRTLGKEKFGDTIYNGRISAVSGKKVDIPVSFETAWGQSFHWQGRGFQATINKPGWVASNLETMTSSRDTQTITHHHDTFEHYLEIKDDPCRSPLTVNAVIMNENKSEIKDSVPCCDWQSPHMWWTDMEAAMFRAATGIPMDEHELGKAAERSRLLFRAILIRNFGRDREMEVNAIFPSMTYPDANGETVEWDEWNDLVDLYYDGRGWDMKTGWPMREMFERYGLSDVADELEKAGKLPVA